MLYGVFAQYRFRCVLGELGRFREGTGSREPVPGWTVSGNPVLGTRGIEKVPGSGDSVPKVPKVTVFRRYTFVLWKYTLALWNCTFVLWKYAGVLWKYTFVLWKNIFVLRKYTFVRWKYTFVHTFALWKCAFGRWKYTFVLCKYTLYFATMLGQGKNGN